MEVKIVQLAALLLVFVTMLLPFLFSFVQLYGLQGSEEEKAKLRRLGSLLSFLFNGATLLAGMVLAYVTRHLLRVALQILSTGITCQDLIRFGVMCLVRTTLAWCFCRVLQKFFQNLYTERWGRARVSFLVCLTLLISALCCFAGESGSGSVKITEICRKTMVDWEDPAFGYEITCEGSYVEITNFGVLPWETKHMFLSARENALRYSELEDVVLAPGESMRHAMGEKVSMPLSKKGGDTVYLSNSLGGVTDSVMLPALERDERYTLRDGKWKLIVPKKAVQLGMPAFSAAGGFYEEAFDLTLSAEEGLTVYYTLDGSIPTEQSQKYTGPINVYNRSSEPNVYRAIRNVQRDYLNKTFSGEKPVDKAFVVRAVAADDKGNCSPVATATYFVGLEKYRDRTVISLVSDPEGLFSDETGICVTGGAYDAWYAEVLKNTPEGEEMDTSGMPDENYNQMGMDWERPASMEVYQNGQSILQQEVGIRVQGHSARYSGFLKRFSIFARKEYSGSTWLDENLVSDVPQHSLVLRRGDLYALCQKLCAQRDVATQDFKEVTAFLDGEFWYDTYLFEKFSEKNMASKYGLTDENVVLVKNGERPGNANDGENGYDDFRDYLANTDFSVPENYAHLGEIMDIQSYIDMICINAYMSNMDYTEFWNNLLWRTVYPENTAKGDGRWRWGLLDMDLGWSQLLPQYGDLESYEIDPFTMEGMWQRVPLTQWRVFAPLRRSPDFCRQFVISFMDIMNTTLSPENGARAIAELGITSKQIAKFMEHRPEYAAGYLAKEFGLSQPETITLISEYPIQINTAVSEPKGGIWTGRYFTEYPITVKTEREDFVGWEITSGGQTQQYHDREVEIPVTRGGMTIRAIFE